MKKGFPQTEVVENIQQEKGSCSYLWGFNNILVIRTGTVRSASGFKQVKHNELQFIEALALEVAIEYGKIGFRVTNINKREAGIKSCVVNTTCNHGEESVKKT